MWQAFLPAYLCTLFLGCVRYSPYTLCCRTGKLIKDASTPLNTHAPTRTPRPCAIETMPVRMLTHARTRAPEPCATFNT